MGNITGKVRFLNEKNFNGKLLYSIKLADDESFYSCGTTRPNVAQGDMISFDAKETPNGRMQVDVRSIKVNRAKQEVVTPGMGRDAYWDKKAQDDRSRQATIEYQAARNSAIAAAGVILNAGALKLPAKDADKYGVVIGLINDLTMKYFEETKTLGAKKDEPNGKGNDGTAGQTGETGDAEATDGDWE